MLTYVTAYADTITVTNKTDTDLWCAPYTYTKNEYTRIEEPLLLKSNSTTPVTRPSLPFSQMYATDRYLLVNTSPTPLLPKLNTTTMTNTLPINIGLLHGSSFYINVKNNALKSYTWAEWQIAPAVDKVTGIWKKGKEFVQEAILSKIDKTRYLLSSAIAQQLQNLLPAVKNNPNKSRIATIRIGNDLCPEEKAYLTKRKPIVKNALESFLGRSLDGKYIPTIARIDTGGGIRMMISSTGATLGLDAIGLLNGLTYFVGLSGSTWFLSTWVTSQLPIRQYAEKLIPTLGRNLTQLNKQEAGLLSNALVTKVLFTEPITTVDVYNALLNNMLFNSAGDKSQQMYLSAQGPIVQNAQVPFPIYTAVRGEERAASEWYEFTPYEVGGWWLNCYVPSWAFGRQFQNGKSIDFAPEQSMPLGTWGSAYAGNIENIYVKIENNIPEVLKPIMRKIMVDVLGQERFSWAEFFNFSAGVAQSPIRDLKTIRMVDAAALPGFGLPYPAISGLRPERTADIILLIDYSDNPTTGSTLRTVSEFARSHGLQFPTINYQEMGSTAIQVFKDENNPKTPVIIRVSRIIDERMRNALNTPAFEQYKKYVDGFNIETCISKEFCKTINFSYTPDEIRQLTAYSEFQIVSSKDIIKDAINWIIDKRS